MNESLEYPSCDTPIHSESLTAACTPWKGNIQPRARLSVTAVTRPGKIAFNISEGRAVKH